MEEVHKAEAVDSKRAVGESMRRTYQGYPCKSC